MSESINIPAHIENGEVRLDAPLPNDVERVEVVAYRRPASSTPTGLDLLAFLDSLPVGTKSRSELDARLDAERQAWD